VVSFRMHGYMSMSEAMEFYSHFEMVERLVDQEIWRTDWADAGYPRYNGEHRSRRR